MKDFQLPISQMTQPDQTQMGFGFSTLIEVFIRFWAWPLGLTRLGPAVP
jgi:hypothetical protein